MKNLINCVVMNEADRILDAERKNSKYDITIQSGCSLTKKRIAQLSDNVGDNISDLNPSYSELTALYWVWKNKKSDYIGWSHYRRRLDVSDEKLNDFIQNDYDVLMPLPMVLGLSVEKQYLSVGPGDAWYCMLDVMKKKSPEYYNVSPLIFNNNILFPYCMGIYKYDYFNSYCEWLFPILDEVYKTIGLKWDVYHNRYIAFLAERLHSLYFIVNCQNLKYELLQCNVFSSVENDTFVNSNLSKKEIMDKVQNLLNKHQAYKAFLYMQDVQDYISKCKDDELIKLYKVIYTIRQENLYTEQILCKEDKDIKVLINKYNYIVDILKKIIVDEISINEISYIKQNNISIYALKIICQIEKIENTDDKINCIFV